MKIVGILASAVVAAGALLAPAVGFKSMPDIQYYRRIRNM